MAGTKISSQSKREVVYRRQGRCGVKGQFVLASDL